MSKSSFYFFPHQGKEKALIEALRTNGWKQEYTPRRADNIFYDVDILSQANTIRANHRNHKNNFLYPHSARPAIFHDAAEFVPSPYVHAQFVGAEGHIEILRRMGYEKPLEVIGWYFCPMREFQPRTEIRKILFAPIHPNADGSLCNVDKKINADTFWKLYDLVGNNQIDLTVRYLHTLDKNGLQEIGGVKYIEGKPDQSYKEIDEADIVVSHQTFAFIAIARGVPTVMMGENIPPRWGTEKSKNFCYVKSWDKYKELMIYPYDVLAEMDTMELFKRTAESDMGIMEWKARLIGEPFDAKNFVKKVEKYL